MRISMIVAKSKNDVIGLENKLPWSLKTDLANFKKVTMGHHVILGRKTFESLGSKPLPGRFHLVVSNEPKAASENVLWFNSVFRALKYAERQGDKEAFIIGGAQIYKACLNLVDRLYLTEVQTEVKGDTYFPPLSLKNWNLVSETVVSADADNQFAFTMRILDRKKV
ncbi:MAG: dihydrofolate reductase [Bacteriovoracaceae bacterium]|nr:dihydrofolate reductase [Bacteriovoracaceae bacterium]